MPPTTRSRRRGAIVAPAVAVLLLAVLSPFVFAAQQSDRVAVGDTAIDFTMESIDGETYSLSEHRGEKTIVVIFFRGTW